MSKKPTTKAELIVEAVGIEVPCCGKDECVECPYETPAVEPAVEAPAPAGRYIVKDGDTWASIAANKAPKGMKRHDYALQLVEKNNGKTLNVGVEVAL